MQELRDKPQLGDGPVFPFTLIAILTAYNLDTKNAGLPMKSIYLSGSLVQDQDFGG